MQVNIVSIDGRKSRWGGLTLEESLLTNYRHANFSKNAQLSRNVFYCGTYFWIFLWNKLLWISQTFKILDRVIQDQNVIFSEPCMSNGNFYFLLYTKYLVRKAVKIEKKVWNFSHFFTGGEFKVIFTFFRKWKEKFLLLWNFTLLRGKSQNPKCKTFHTFFSILTASLT